MKNGMDFEWIFVLAQLPDFCSVFHTRPPDEKFIQNPSQNPFLNPCGNSQTNSSPNLETPSQIHQGTWRPHRIDRLPSFKLSACLHEVSWGQPGNNSTWKLKAEGRYWVMFAKICGCCTIVKNVLCLPKPLLMDALQIPRRSQGPQTHTKN